MHQPVDWQEWGEDAFARAAAEDKPILLDIGAVWCHWCHVMDRESYEDPALAAWINQHFVAVKVDRDERPDVDTRYQAAVAAISGQMDGRSPPCSPRRASLISVARTFPGMTAMGGRDLPACCKPWPTRGRPSGQMYWSRPAAWSKPSSTTRTSLAGQARWSLDLVEQMVTSAIEKFDRHHGGFGSQPKFAHPPALDLLLDVAGRTQQPEPREAAVVTLTKMAHGGVYDQLAGGFHRYSVDERWVVPHFEKMLYDNAALLGNYVHAFQSFVDPAMAAGGA